MPVQSYFQKFIPKSSHICQTMHDSHEDFSPKLIDSNITNNTYNTNLTPNTQNNNLSTTSSNCPQKKQNYLSETEESQNLKEENLSQASNNCVSTLSQQNLDFNSNRINTAVYSPFNKSPFMFKENSNLVSRVNSVGLLFNSQKCEEVQEELHEDEDFIESDF